MVDFGFVLPALPLLCVNVINKKQRTISSNLWPLTPLFSSPSEKAPPALKRKHMTHIHLFGISCAQHNKQTIPDFKSHSLYTRKGIGYRWSWNSSKTCSLACPFLGTEVTCTQWPKTWDANVSYVFLNIIHAISWKHLWSAQPYLPICTY